MLPVPWLPRSTPAAFPSCSAAIAASCSDRSWHCAAGAATALPSWTATPTSSTPATSRTARSHRSTWRWQPDAVLICSPTSTGCGRWSGTRTSRSSATGVLDDNDHFLGEHIRSTAITVADLTEVREAGTGRVLEKALATLTKGDLKGFWVHLDVDVLDDALMPAVDYRHPGGLTWQEATEILGGLLAGNRARG